MAASRLLFLPIVAIFLTTAYCFPSLDTPSYDVVHSGSGFEIRRYLKSVWVTASSEDVSFQRATQGGFHRLFQYIQGANMNWSKVPMTTPVLTGIVPSAGPFCSSAFAVRFYVPSDYQESPPTPIPELDLSIERWDKQYVAVRQFSGYAQDSNIAREASHLAESLRGTPWANATAVESPGVDAYAIAQYDAPFKILGRTNEVWVKVAYEESSVSDSHIKLVV